MAISNRPTTERSIQEACCDLLALDGWRRIRTDLPHLRGLGVSERGIADDLFLRYVFGEEMKAISGLRKRGFRIPQCDEPRREDAQVLFIEWKRKTGKAMQHQHDWHQAERARGALTLIAGIDFVASVEGFMAWYEKSGLMRKKLSIGGSK